MNHGRRKFWPTVVITAVALGLAAVLASPSKAASALARCRKTRGKKARISMEEARALALKWGQIRGIPASWILAAMAVESEFNPCTVGDQGRSLGLMQINTGAHGPELIKAGLIKQYGDLFDPDTNVSVGSYILALRHQQALTALGKKTLRVPIGVAVLLAHKGPRDVMAALRRGTSLVDVYGPAVYAQRSGALEKAEALV